MHAVARALVTEAEFLALPASADKVELVDGEVAMGPLDIIPLVCIEVLSADRVTDRIFKRMLYAAAGVAEYWTVEPSGLVERWTGAGLTQSELLADRLVTPVLPDFTLDVAELVALMRA